MILCLALVLSGCAVQPPKIEPSSLIKIVPLEETQPVVQSISSKFPPSTPPPRQEEIGALPLVLLFMSGFVVGSLASQ